MAASGTVSHAPMFGLEAGDGLRLELAHPAHAARLFAAVDENRAHLGDWFPWVAITAAVADTAAYLSGALEEYVRGEAVPTVLVLGEAVVGTAGLYAIQKDGSSARVGYWLAANYEGRGLMVRAVRALCGFGFSVLNLRRLDVLCAVSNERSARVAERAGMVRTGRLPAEVTLAGARAGEVEDALVYSLTADAFRQTGASGDACGAPEAGRPGHETETDE